jgi:hypothetical protein
MEKMRWANASNQTTDGTVIQQISRMPDDRVSVAHLRVPADGMKLSGALQRREAMPPDESGRSRDENPYHGTKSG